MQLPFHKTRLCAPAVTACNIAALLHARARIFSLLRNKGLPDIRFGPARALDTLNGFRVPPGMELCAFIVHFEILKSRPKAGP
jgi:hypothetical protein